MFLLLIIVTDETQYSCYIWYSRYTHGHAGVRQMVCGTKCHTELSATPQTWWGPPLESVGATSRILHRGVLAWWRHPQCACYSDPVHDTFNNPTIVTSETLVIWSLSRLDNDTRMPCPDGFNWSVGSSMDYQWYGTLEEIDENIRWYWLLLLYKSLDMLDAVYYCPFLFVIPCHTSWYLLHCHI